MAELSRVFGMTEVNFSACVTISILMDARMGEMKQWHTEGGEGLGGFKHHPKFRMPSKIVPNSTPLWKLLKIAEFRMPTPQDVRKKGSKIVKLPRFAIVLH